MIFEILEEGADRAITGRRLCQILNISARDLSETIERERRAGIPICASCGKPAGYYLAADKEEMLNYCRQLHHRAGEIFKTRRACMQSIDKLPTGERKNGSK